MSIMYARMGLSVVSALSQRSSAKLDAKLQKITQDYNNAMQDISKAQTLNTFTENEISVRDAGVRAAEAIQVQALRDRGAATAGAAAAGVQGSAVQASLRGLERGKLQARKALADRLRAQGRSDLNQRRNLLMGAAFSRDISVIPRPDIASSLLGLGASMIDIWDSEQPEGSKIADGLAGIGRR